MALVNSGFDIQEAVYDLLMADTAMKALVGDRIYDAAPPSPTLPYVIIGDMTGPPPETTSTSTLTKYTMEISAIVGANPASDEHTLGFETGHKIIGRALTLLQEYKEMDFGDARKILRVSMRDLKTQRVRGQLDTEPDYRIITQPVEVWVWQAR